MTTNVADNNVGKMPKEATVMINYEGEYKRIKELFGELEKELDYYKTNILEKNKVIAHLEGQVKAFKFCIARGETE